MMGLKEDMPLKNAIDIVKQSNVFLFPDRLKGAVGIVLAAAEKQMEDAEDAEKWRAIEWVGNNRRADARGGWTEHTHPRAHEVAKYIDYYLKEYRAREE